MRGQQRFLIAGLLAALLPPAGAVAAVGGAYKWVDRDGGVHYDDSSIYAQRLTREYIASRRIPEQPDWVGIVPAAWVAEVELLCSLSRERLSNYRNASTVYGREPGGLVYPMSQNQVGLLIAETERDSRRYCAADAARRYMNERIAAAQAQQTRAKLPAGR